jgi:hypothetical protein
MSEIQLVEAAKVMCAALEKVSKPETKQEPEYLTIDEACKIAKVTRWTIRRWTKFPDSGIIVIKLGSSKSCRIRIEKASFMAFLASKAVKAEASEPQEINNGNTKGGEAI